VAAWEPNELDEDDFDDEFDDDFDDLDDALVAYYYERYMRRDELLRQLGICAFALVLVALVGLVAHHAGLFEPVRTHTPQTCASRAAKEGADAPRIVRMDCFSDQVLASVAATQLGPRSWAAPAAHGAGDGVTYVAFGGEAYPATRALCDPVYRVIIARIDVARPQPMTAAQLPTFGQPLTVLGVPMKFAGTRTARGRDIWVLSGPLPYGHAGAPVIDARGQIIGMVSGFTANRIATLVIPAPALASDVQTLEEAAG
jgi:hypothetical protein